MFEPTTNIKHMERREDRKALMRFLAERSNTQVARLTGKQLRSEFQGWMETLFTATVKHGLTIVVDDFAKCVVGDLGGNSSAARYATTCAEHLRAKIFWAVAGTARRSNPGGSSKRRKS